MRAGRLAVAGLGVAMFAGDVLVGLESATPEEEVSTIEIATHDAMLRPENEEGTLDGDGNGGGNQRRVGRSTDGARGSPVPSADGSASDGSTDGRAFTEGQRLNGP